MNVRFLRRVAAALIALFMFAQGSVVLAACALDRGSMAQAMAQPAAEPSDCCGKEMEAPVDAACVAHCTVDLQLAGFPLVLVHDAVEAPVLTVPGAEIRPKLMPPVPPSLAVPRRILLHSFLI